MLREWDKLPEYMKTEEVRPYYEFKEEKNKFSFEKRI